jgi:hypothetical protein
MRTIGDISNEIHGAKPVAMYVSPAYDATLARAIQRPGREQLRVHHLLLVFRHSTAPPSDPCLVVSAEALAGGGEPVLGVYDEKGCEILRQERGDWADITPFGRRAVELAGQRLGTTLTEYDSRRRAA